MAKKTQKTHQGIAKKLKPNAKKSVIKICKQGGNHNTGKKSTKFNRNKRKGNTLSSGDAKRYKNVI